MPYDPRLNWLKYLITNSGIILSVPDNPAQSTIKTLLNYFSNNSDDIDIYHQEKDDLLATQNKGRNKLSKTTFHLISSRESSKKLHKTLNKNNQKIIAEYSVIPSWNNPRWFIPKERNLGPGRMSLMINPSRPLALLAISAFRLLKTFSQEQWVFSDKLILSQDKFKKDNNETYSDLDNILKHTGKGVKSGIIYTGSFGPIQKFTIELLDKSGEIIAFAKVGHNKYSNKAIERETDILKTINTISLNIIKTPESLGNTTLKNSDDKVLIQKLLNGGKTVSGISGICIQALIELFIKTSKNSSIPLNSYTNSIISKVKAIDTLKLPVIHQGVPDYLEKKLRQIEKKFPKIMIPVGLSHGDFTRWNVREDMHSLYVIDWEEAAYRPPGHDLFNLIFSETLQAKKQGTKEVIKLLHDITDNEANICRKYFKETLKSNPISINALILLYLAEKISYSLWHIEQHNIFHYPEKDSFSRIICSSQEAFEDIIKSIP